MESPKLDKVMHLVKCLISQIIMEMNLQGTNKNSNQTILTQKMLINKEISLLVEETLIIVPEDPASKDQIEVEIEMTLGIIEDPEVLTVTEDKTNVKIEEILILKLLLKSTSLELIEIKVKRILKSISLNSERLKISL